MKNIEVNNNMAYWVGNLERPGWWKGKQKFRLIPYIADDDDEPDFSVETLIKEVWTHRLYWSPVKETGKTLGWSKEKINDLETFVATHAVYDIMFQISGHESKIK